MAPPFSQQRAQLNTGPSPVVIRSIATIVTLVIVFTLAIPAAFGQTRTRAQSSPRSSIAHTIEPPELSGPPKKWEPPSPTQREFANSNLLEKLGATDPKVLADVVQRLSAFIEKDPADPDFPFLRATLNCQIGANKDSILNDINTALKVRTPGKAYVYDSVRDLYGLRAKVEFDQGRYEAAMGDLDAAIQVDYSNATSVFNDGNVKPNEPTHTPCVWKQADFDKLAKLFPKDYRPPLFTALYLLQFTNYGQNPNFEPIFEALAHSAGLNPKSALPLYYRADPYTVGRISGVLSMANAKCNEDVQPRTANCLTLDDSRRQGLRYLTMAIAADPSFEPAYALRATAHYQLRQFQQAIRDFTKAAELNPNARIYNDRGLAEMELRQYQNAVNDFTKGIAQGCDDSLCPAWENRADAYLKLHDYPHAIADISHKIRNILAGTIFGFNIDQFRRIYPEYDSAADDVLCERLRVLFNPQMSYETYAKQFLVDAKDVDDFVVPDLFLKRGDAYADMGDSVRASHEYDRVSNGYPKWATNAFREVNGKRIRIRQ